MYHKFLSFDFFPIISSLQHTLFALYDYLLAGFCVRVRRCLCEVEGTENHIGDEKRKEMKRRKNAIEWRRLTCRRLTSACDRTFVCACRASRYQLIIVAPSYTSTFAACTLDLASCVCARTYTLAASALMTQFLFRNRSHSGYFDFISTMTSPTKSACRSLFIVHRLRYGQNRTSG